MSPYGYILQDTEYGASSMERGCVKRFGFGYGRQTTITAPSCDKCVCVWGGGVLQCAATEIEA